MSSASDTYHSFSLLPSFLSSFTFSRSGLSSRQALLALCVLTLFSLSTPQELNCSQLSAPTGARLGGVISTDIARYFTSFIRVEKSTNTLSLLNPQGRFATFLVYNITEEGNPVFVEQEAVFGSLFKRDISEQQEILQDTQIIRSFGGALYFKNYQAAGVMGLVGSEPFHGAYSLQSGAAFSFEYEGRRQSPRAIPSGSTEVWFSPGPRDLLINEKSWVYLDARGNIIANMAERTNGTLTFTDTLKRVIISTMGIVSSLLNSLLGPTGSDVQTRIYHASSLSINTNLVERIRSTDKRLISNNVLSYLSVSDLTADTTLSVLVTRNENSNDMPLFRVFVLSWKEQVLSQLYYASAALPSTSNVIDVTFCLRDTSICVLQEAHLSIFPLNDVTRVRSVSLPSSNTYLKWMETSLNSYLVSSTAIHRVVLLGSGTLLVTQNNTFADQTLQPQSVSIFERDGRELVFYNIISQTSLLYCFAAIPAPEAPPFRRPTPRPTPRPNNRPNPLDTIPTSVRLIPDKPNWSRANRTFSRVQPQRIEKPFIPNSVIMISANSSKGNSSRLPPGLSGAALVSIGLPASHGHQEKSARMIRVDSGSTDAHRINQDIVSSIISVSLLDNDSHPIQPPAPVAICFAVPSSYIDQAKSAHLVVFNETSLDWDFVSNITVRFDATPPPPPPTGGIASRGLDADPPSPSSTILPTPSGVDGVIYFCGWTSHFSTFSILLSSKTDNQVPGKRDEGGIPEEGDSGPPMIIIAGALIGGVVVIVIVVLFVGWKSKFYKRLPWFKRNQLYITVDET